jgi:hypothetical protein|tara:strand:- start:2599 stop:2787 length:189 start_codon:yes stop_codon:yes gene_type:complete
MKKQLLCPTVCCCPEITLNDNIFTIKDDHGQRVLLSTKDIKKIVKDINELDSMPRASLDIKR